jgi:hypothetical protein
MPRNGAEGSQKLLMDRRIAIGGGRTRVFAQPRGDLLPATCSSRPMLLLGEIELAEAVRPADLACVHRPGWQTDSPYRQRDNTPGISSRSRRAGHEDAVFGEIARYAPRCSWRNRRSPLLMRGAAVAQRNGLTSTRTRRHPGRGLVFRRFGRCQGFAAALRLPA